MGDDIVDFFKNLGQAFLLIFLLTGFLIYVSYPLLFLFFTLKIFYNKLVKKDYSKYSAQLKDEFRKFRTVSDRGEGFTKLFFMFLFAPLSILLIISVFIGLRDFKGIGMFIVWITFILIMIHLILNKTMKEKSSLNKKKR